MCFYTKCIASTKMDAPRSHFGPWECRKSSTGSSWKTVSSQQGGNKKVLAVKLGMDRMDI